MKIIASILNNAHTNKLFLKYALLQQFFIDTSKRNAYWIHNQKRQNIYLNMKIMDISLTIDFTYAKGNYSKSLYPLKQYEISHNNNS